MWVKKGCYGYGYVTGVGTGVGTWTGVEGRGRDEKVVMKEGVEEEEGYHSDNNTVAAAL